MKSRLFVPLLLLLNACSTARVNPNMPNTPLISQSEYESVIQTYSDHQKIYDGLYQIMEVRAVLHNSKVNAAMLQQNSKTYQWTEEQLKAEQSKLDQKNAKETEVFISFFVPERKQDDLSKGRTLWKLFLDAGGKRYEGKATKYKTILAELTTLYPEHNRWSTPYKIIFPVPTSMVENGESKLTITGPAGSVNLTFKAQQ